MSSAKPLKTPSKVANGSPTPTNEAPPSTTTSASGAAVNPGDITSPHELTAFVRTFFTFHGILLGELKTDATMGLLTG
ncbi:hypothetical protein A7U60_g8261 [Sanghuangporus baumii]|uniref:Uncharacterized protein n=1 Tax=Sanghuangporus baumii TaxID=108892 RepID=A0A9Q5MYU5_SANBA|nr:hypothetical protein A7U60_g8261 [Sanghuangporus baumii]